MISKSLTKRIFQSIEQFSIEKFTQPLGVGSFGTVRLGVHKFTNKSYAIKIICVDKNFNQNQLCLLQRQITIHYNLNHPHIIKLWDVIQEKDKIYLIMEYAHKGNLFNFQSHNHQFSEIDAFKIFIQTIDAIDYLHKNNIFHRDIKPENILLDHQFNIKLCDFGWAAPDINRKRSTFCGTYQYMAPEMINELQYDFSIDIWALGVLLFQLLHASAPFPAQTLEQMKQKISTGSYEININFSSEVKALIMSILQFDAQDRPSIYEIKTHIWIQKMKKLIQQKNNQGKFQKKKCKNAYGSLDFTPSKKQVSKFGSMLFQDSSNKKQTKQIKAFPQQLKKKVKKKCKTLEEQSLEQMVKPLKNMLTLHTQKQNDGPQIYLNQVTRNKQKYKMLTKITLTKNQPHHKTSKLNLNRLNNYFADLPANSDIKNFKSQDKIDKNGVLLSNRNVPASSEFKKKKKKVG